MENQLVLFMLFRLLLGVIVFWEHLLKYIILVGTLKIILLNWEYLLEFFKSEIAFVETSVTVVFRNSETYIGSTLKCK